MRGEFDLISKYFAPLAGPEGLGLVDDAALVSPSSGLDLVVTKDLLLENVHFRTADPAASVGHKALAVNVSDCIAKGAEPRHYWLGLALPKGLDENWVQGFCAGLRQAQDAFGCTLAGGDTTRSLSGIVVSVTLMGDLPAGAMVKRSGAKVGDELYVTGNLGDAALGLWWLQEGREGPATLVKRYQQPNPRTGFSSHLRRFATASADVSDGLIADAGHIAEASDVGIVIHKDALPVSTEAQALIAAHPELESAIWSGGDDYEVVFTAPPAMAPEIKRAAEDLGISISRIGEVVSGENVQLLDLNGENVHIASRGYVHF